jgi:hypothetical protein
MALGQIIGRSGFYTPTTVAAAGMTTVLDTIAHGDDDALSVDKAATDTEYTGAGPYGGISSDSTDRYEHGMRFHLSVPQGATIDTAYLTVSYGNRVGVDNTDSMGVYAYDVDTAPVFVNGHTHLLSTHATLGATVVNWQQGTISTQTVTSPNIASVVQAVVDKVGWASENYIGFVVQMVGATWTANENYSYKDFEDGGATIPKLKVVYH